MQNAEEQEREREPEQGDTGGPDWVTPPDGETRQATLLLTIRSSSNYLMLG